LMQAPGFHPVCVGDGLGEGGVVPQRIS